MMNKVMLMGRLTRDPDIRRMADEAGTSLARYTLAVDRRTGKDGERQADFISCVVFGKSVDFVEKYLKQGSKIAITGRIQTGSYMNRNGEKVYSTDVVVEEHEFAESKSSAEQRNQMITGNALDGVTVYASTKPDKSDKTYVADFDSRDEAYDFAYKMLSSPRNMERYIIVQEYISGQLTENVVESCEALEMSRKCG